MPALTSVEPTLYAVPFAAGVLVLCGLLVVLVRLADDRLGKSMVVWTFGGALWCTGGLLRVLATTTRGEFYWFLLRVFGMEVAAFGFFFVIAAYTDRTELFDRRLAALLLAFPFLTQAIAWTNDAHGLFVTVVDSATPPLVTAMAPEPWFLVHTVYTAGLVLTGAYWLLGRFLRAHREGLYRRQTGLMLVGVVSVLTPNAAFHAGLTAVDWTPVGGAITAMFVTVALFRYRILDISPIARDAIVENMESAVVVVDTEDVIIDANHRAARLVDAGVEELVGTSLSDALAGYPDISQAVTTGGPNEQTVSVTDGGRTSHYDVTTSEIRDSTDAVVGRIVLFSDVTDEVQRREQLERQKAQLERQNARLDQFASVISHDLRNPLGIAQTYTDFAADTGDQEDFEAVREAHDRMDEMIDDMLMMARAGTTVEDPEQVGLADVASDAWATTQTEGATLETALPEDTVVHADPSLLQNVFENLFRNAVDHNDPPVRVTVGLLGEDDSSGRGFYVADDGAGIPSDQRDDVFDHGYSLSEGGTGFGLAIVRDIVDSHEWELTLTESEDGGARFDIWTGG